MFLQCFHVSSRYVRLTSRCIFHLSRICVLFHQWVAVLYIFFLLPWHSHAVLQSWNCRRLRRVGFLCKRLGCGCVLCYDWHSPRQILSSAVMQLQEVVPNVSAVYTQQQDKGWSKTYLSLSLYIYSTLRHTKFRKFWEVFNKEIWHIECQCCELQVGVWLIGPDFFACVKVPVLPPHYDSLTGCCACLYVRVVFLRLSRYILFAIYKQVSHDLKEPGGNR